MQGTEEGALRGALFSSSETWVLGIHWSRTMTRRPSTKGLADPQPAHLLVVQLGLHLAEAVHLLGLIAGDVGQELKQAVTAAAEGVMLSPGTLQALDPAGQSQPGL